MHTKTNQAALLEKIISVQNGIVKGIGKTDTA